MEDVFPIIWGPEAGRFGCGDGLPLCRLVWSINITRIGKQAGGLGACPQQGYAIGDSVPLALAGHERNERRTAEMAWEFEGLFDQVIDGETAEQVSFWRSIPSAIRVGKMGYRTKTTKAGPRLEAEIYPVFGKETRGRLRAEKRNLTPERMQKLNTERSDRHAVMLAEGNFTREDIHLTLTYKGETPDYKRARMDVRNFLDKVKRRREKLELPELKYFGAIEGGADGTRERIHVHLLLSGGISREELEQLWAKGYANADRLRPDEDGLEAVARYIVKQSRNGKEKYKKRWFASRNLKQPKVRTSDTKVSNGKVRKVAGDMLNEARPILERAYPGYAFVKCSVHGSDLTDGVYIRCVMRKREKVKT